MGIKITLPVARTRDQLRHAKRIGVYKDRTRSEPSNEIRYLRGVSHVRLGPFANLSTRTGRGDLRTLMAILPLGHVKAR